VQSPFSINLPLVCPAAKPEYHFRVPFPHLRTYEGVATGRDNVLSISARTIAIFIHSGSGSHLQDPGREGYGSADRDIVPCQDLPLWLVSDGPVLLEQSSMPACLHAQGDRSMAETKTDKSSDAARTGPDADKNREKMVKEAEKSVHEEPDDKQK
jgi:hypothetical protein